MTVLKDIQRERGLTTIQIARQLHISASTVSMLLHGRHLHTMSDEQIQALADVLSITFERCWYALQESYNEWRGLPLWVQHQRMSEVRHEVQREMTHLGVVPFPPRALTTYEGSLVLEEERRLQRGQESIPPPLK